jgi:hypothetical protein
MLFALLHKLNDFPKRKLLIKFTYREAKKPRMNKRKLLSNEQTETASEGSDELDADSDADIEQKAALLRKMLGLLNEPAFNVADILQRRLPSVIDDFRLEFFAESDKPN